MPLACDDDRVLIGCPFCHYEFYETAGPLRTGSEIQCPACKKLLFYEAGDFLSYLERAGEATGGAVEPFARLRWQR